MSEEQNIYLVPDTLQAADKGSVVMSGSVTNNGEEKKEEAPAPTKSIVIRWSKQPSHPSQLAEMPDTVRQTAIAPFVCKLDHNTKSNAETAYSKLMDRMVPTAAPECVVIDERVEFYEGEWHMFMRYAELEYQKL